MDRNLISKFLKAPGDMNAAEKPVEKTAYHGTGCNSTFNHEASISPRNIQESAATSIRTDTTMVLDNLSNTFTIENESTWYTPLSSTFDMEIRAPLNTDAVDMQESLGLLSIDQMKDFTCTINKTYCGDDLQNIPEDDTFEVRSPERSPNEPLMTLKSKYVHDRMSSTPLGTQTMSRTFLSSPLNTSTDTYLATEHPDLDMTRELLKNANLVIEQIKPKSRTCLIKPAEIIESEACNEDMHGFAVLEDASMLVDQSLTLLDITLNDSHLVNAMETESIHSKKIELNRTTKWTSANSTASSCKPKNEDHFDGILANDREVETADDVVFYQPTEKTDSVNSSLESKTATSSSVSTSMDTTSSTLSSTNSASATSMLSGNKTIDLPKKVQLPKILQKTVFKVAKPVSGPKSITSRYSTTETKRTKKAADAAPVRKFTYLKKNKLQVFQNIPDDKLQSKNDRATRPSRQPIKDNNAGKAKSKKVSQTHLTIPTRKPSTSSKSVIT